MIEEFKTMVIEDGEEYKFICTKAFLIECDEDGNLVDDPASVEVGEIWWGLGEELLDGTIRLSSLERPIWIEMDREEFELCFEYVE